MRSVKDSQAALSERGGDREEKREAKKKKSGQVD